MFFPVKDCLYNFISSIGLIVISILSSRVLPSYAFTNIKNIVLNNLHHSKKMCWNVGPNMTIKFHPRCYIVFLPLTQQNEIPLLRWPDSLIPTLAPNYRWPWGGLCPGIVAREHGHETRKVLAKRQGMHRHETRKVLAMRQGMHRALLSGRVYISGFNFR